MKNQTQKPWLNRLRMGLSAVALSVLAACGGGEGASGPVRAPDLKYNVQSAVLQNGVKSISSGLTGPDSNGIFIASDVTGYKIGQIFIVDKVAYKVTNIEPSDNGAGGQILTMPATLNETFSDLKMNYTMHPVN